MIAFDPTDDQKMMLESVGQLGKSLATRVRELEKQRAVPEDLRKKAHEMGLGLVAFPESHGGAGLGLLTAVLLEEVVASGDPAAAFGFGGPGAMGYALAELGTAEQAARALAPFGGDDGHARFGAVAWGEPRPHATRPGLSTVATKDGSGWVLRGTKAYVVNADRAETFVVFAQVDEGKGWDGLGAFLVKKGTPGAKVLARETTLGLDVASFGGLELDAVRVDDGARLLGGGDFSRATLRFFAKWGLVVAAREVGLARAAFETTREYVETRKAFGKPIGHFQGVAFTLADRAMDVDSARALVHRAAWCWDANEKEEDALVASAYAIAHAHEVAMRCGDDGVQLHGGAGFMRDYPVEKYMRDAKQLNVCGLPAACADQLAAAVQLGRALDLGLLLPNAESQSAFV
jgi:alkylation response protein AidB-like acyl-CoA dehydrogenase